MAAVCSERADLQVGATTMLSVGWATMLAELHGAGESATGELVGIVNKWRKKVEATGVDEGGMVVAVDDGDASYRAQMFKWVSATISGVRSLNGTSNPLLSIFILCMFSFQKPLWASKEEILVSRYWVWVCPDFEMDRRSWLWRKKSSEKSPGETESSGSISSHSERYFDDQEASRESPNHNTQSPEITSKATVIEVNGSIQNLSEKLSAALLNISAKEDLVKQHAKVAEEAVTGWEKAENEVVAFKQQLEAAYQKSSALEDRMGHLDGALKECVRQLRQVREEQEQKIHEAVIKKTRELESAKFELKSQLVELQTQLQAAKAEVAASADPDLCPMLEAAGKENSALKLELLVRSEQLEIMTLERDLSTQAAETASKQQLESIKKVAKLEAECRRIKAMARKATLVNEHKSVAASLVYVESLTDSQSDSGERLLGLENDTHKMSVLELNDYEPSCSDSWASARITDLDQFKNEKTVQRNLTASSIEISLMDDFLEMERLAALPDTESGSSGVELGYASDRPRGGESPLKAELEAMIQRTAELEEKLVRMEAEKAGLEMALTESQDQLGTSQGHLREFEVKLVEVQRQLALVNESKQTAEVEREAATAKREEVESHLVGVEAEVQTLLAKVVSLEAEVEKERALSVEIVAKCQKLEDELLRKKHEAELWQTMSSNGELKIKQEKELVVAAGKLAECQKTIASLGQQLKSLATLDDFLIDYEKPHELTGGGLPFPRGGAELLKLHSNDTYLPKRDADSLKIVSNGSGLTMNGRDKVSPPSSSSSSSSASSLDHAVTSEKSRKGFRKLFSRSECRTQVGNQ
ncbi:hypothetical protein HHK36_030429 [Tetracentron sinense]|uniref:Filament-like plant protein n=1 Tax=Tetracentron sinense TaxID=13715 RepID=A0A834YC38_TETSI|nr:hypothetical protein HHK36_030429 [Tetracentron sinense]